MCGTNCHWKTQYDVQRDVASGGGHRTVRLKNQNKLIKMKKNFTADKINNLVHFDW